ncbi:MAG: DUF4386 domain-containing protein [Anaerolineaceae bacterium]|nr:DUF4386 domain-containing protein [Anaerolineaceae bacterium]
MNSNKTIARTAGVLYFFVILFGMFAELYVNLKLIEPGDAVATSSNIMASELLFRIGFLSGIFHHTCFLLLVLVLYKLLKSVNKNHALLMLILGLSSVPIMMLNMLNQFAVLLLLSGADYLTVFNIDQLQALALLFLNFQSHGYYLAGMFSGLFLLPLGYLVIKSGFIPRIFGILLVIGCFGYLIELFVFFVFPSYEMIAYLGIAAAIIAEISFCSWLLVKGVMTKELP